MKKVEILGIKVNCLGMAETIAAVEKFITESTPHIVITPNVDHLIKTREDKEFKHIYERADLAVPDGVPLLWAARFLGTPLVERVNGTDLFEALCERAAARGYRIFFLGAAPGIAAEAARKLTERHPDLKVVGTYSPPFDFFNSFTENQKIETMIRAAQPDILFVGLGAPKQEKWIYRHMHKIQVPVSIGIGASFEYVAGVTARAPLWMQRFGLEWLHRVLENPRRYLKRYVADLAFFPLVATQKLKAVTQQRDRVPRPAF
jgi:N-acetylglucosaminyldiphosphoundecaprenol N-acetyl-beta-D-mannosaminyltransferase